MVNSSCTSEPGLRIKTDRGWQLIGGPLQPVKLDDKFGSYPQAVKAHLRLFDEFRGGDSERCK